MPYRKEIKALNIEKGKTLVKVGEKKLPYNKIVFSFSFFHCQSICFRDFNNYYANEQDSKKAVSDFFETIKLLSCLEPKELFSPNMKVQYHYNEFEDNLIIDRIESILVNGYGMPKRKVDEFERMYFEFSFGNGKRVIGTKIYNHIFQILFIDCNHLVCTQSSRNKNLKSSFHYPSSFEKVNNEMNIKNKQLEVLDLFIDSAKKGVYSSVEELIRDYEELFATI